MLRAKRRVIGKMSQVMSRDKVRGGMHSRRAAKTQSVRGKFTNPGNRERERRTLVGLANTVYVSFIGAPGPLNLNTPGQVILFQKAN